MGGVVSAGAVAFGQPPARQGEVASAMLRGSIVGGLTLFCINTIRSACATALRVRVQQLSHSMPAAHSLICLLFHRAVHGVASGGRCDSRTATCSWRGTQTSRMRSNACRASVTTTI